MKVTVKVFATLRESLGWKEKEYDITVRDVGDFFKSVNELYDIVVDRERGEFTSRYKILLNGRDIDFLDGFKTKLKDQDSVFIFPPVGGGAQGRSP